MTVPLFAIWMPWGRVGSNLVVTVLNEYAGIGIANEPTTVLASRRRKEPGAQFLTDLDQLAYLRDFPDVGRFGLPVLRGPLCGVKLSHQSLISPMAAHGVLAERGFRIVAMYRDNHIKTAISQIRAEKRAQAGSRDAWSVSRRSRPPGPMQVRPTLALTRARACAQSARRLRDYLGHFHPEGGLAIRYEELNAAPHDTIRRIADHLGLRLPQKFVLPHQKATDDDLSRSVTNWPEVRAAFADSEFAALLDQDGGPAGA